ncbi:MAG: aldo/keto reductase [Erysipelotrichaceae bacterium]|nr:aldo/keto reductase [Erysipelotrichaceae bacterium]
MIRMETKKLGFGLMRLPKNGEEIDLEETCKMVDAFLEAGFTYFDTARVYVGSEEAIRKALVERHPRDSYTLASKCAAWAGCKTREDAIAQFETSLETAGVEYFDYYLLHNLGGNRTNYFDDWDLWKYFLQKKEEGKIRHLGFSCHGTAEELDEILTKHPEMEFVQLQINYADWDNDSIQSGKCYEVARKHGKQVVVMEPVKGGLLANPADAVQDVFRKQDPDASCASWAIRYAASLEGVLVVLSGMSSLEQMNDNLSYMKDFKGLNETEQKTIAEAQEVLKNLPIIPCTSCDYCAKVCPMSIGVSGLFAAMNQYTKFNSRKSFDRTVEHRVKEKERNLADQCIQCGACEDACPQHISIREELVKIAGFMK